MEKHLLYTDLSPWPWEFRVYVPPCYDSMADRNFPTLYLIHGSNNSDQQWDQLGVDETAEKLIQSGEAPPFLIVMPRDRVWREPREDPFGEALVDHIVPWVDGNYRTLTDRQHRSIGGLSRGAAWAIHLGLSNWEMFGAIGGHSFFAFWTDTGKIPGWLETIPPDQYPDLYLDIGDKDYLLESALWFADLINQKGIPHEWHLYPGRHDDAYWMAHLEDYLRWYVQEW